MIARYLDVELHSLVPFLIDGFVFAIPGSKARMNPMNYPMLSRRQDVSAKEAYRWIRFTTHLNHSGIGPDALVRLWTWITGILPKTRTLVCFSLRATK